MFNQKTTLAQGALGLSRAIYEYQKSGYTVSIPLVDAQDYDLVIEKDGVFQSVQCKTTSVKCKLANNVKSNNQFQVSLRSIKTNTKVTTITKRGKYDLLFVLCSNGDCYSIPTTNLPMSSINVGGNKYARYKLQSM